MTSEALEETTKRREYEIIVNSRPYQVLKTVTYEAVTKLAYPDWAEGDQFKVTYRRAGHGDWKLLPEGGSVEVADGEEFVVERTHRS